MKNFVTTNEK